MSQDLQAEKLDDEDQMTQALAEMRSDRSNEPEAGVEVQPATEVVETLAEPAAAQSPATQAAPEANDTEAKLKAAQAELHKARSEIGRVGALNQKYLQAAQEAASLREKLAHLQQPSQGATSETTAKLAQIAEQVKDFPELSGIVAAVSDALKQSDQKAEEFARRIAAQAVEPLEPLRREQQQKLEVEQQAAYSAAMATFSDTYPTAVEVVKSDEFNGWLRKQPSHIQNAFDSGKTPEEAMTVMDSYDMHLRRSGLTPVAQINVQQSSAQATRQPNANRLQRAAGIPSRTTGSGMSAPPADDFDAALAYFRNKRLAGQRATA